MPLWTYRFAPVVDGRVLRVSVAVGWSESRVTVEQDGALLASDTLRFRQEPYRLQQLRVSTAAGDLLVEVGPRTWYTYGLRVRRDDAVLYQSHADPFAYLPKMQAMLRPSAPGGDGEIDMDRIKRNAPAIGADLALGLLFFIVAKLSNLTTAALVAAGAGLSLYGVQWLLNRVFDRLQRPRIDLLGGLAMFGVVMLLLSAGFAWLFDSEMAVQLKATYLGLLGATFFAIDAWRGAPYLGKRLALYIAYKDIDPRQLAASFALVGATMAAVNAAIALNFSKDTWLLYTVWGDMVLAVVLSMWAIERARGKAAVR
jgi:intracellular septation protein A